jgi:hypothetical protein
LNTRFGWENFSQIFFGVGGKHDIGFGESSLSDNQILLLMGFPQVFKKKEKALFHSDSAFSEG